VQMRLELRNLHKRLKVTSIYVTHDQVEAMTLGDRLVVINDGYVQQIGSPLDLYEQPSTRFVAEFIGSPSMNFIDGRISYNGKLAELSKNLHLPLNPDSTAGQEGREVTVGIRPEHFSLTEQEQSTFSLMVDHTEFHGADTIVYGRLSNNEALLTVRLPHIHRVEPEKPLLLTVAPEYIHLFEQKTGARI